MKWNEFNNLDQLTQIDALSNTKPVLILKHSTTCSISNMALSRIERTWKDEDEQFATPYYLDLLKHRDISNTLASHYNVQHESPQVLLIKEGKCIYSVTHSAINVQEILNHVIG